MSKDTKTELSPSNGGSTEVAELERDELFVKPRYHTRKVEDDAWEVGVVIPGVKREDVNISLEDNELEVIARRYHVLPEGWRPLNEGGPRPNYRLHLELAVDIEEERISAKLEDGILTLRLPVSEAAKPRTISVE